ncbi:MAG: hypothetical protein ABID38_02900 [Candidatus Diapherotrites archaeon]
MDYINCTVLSRELARELGKKENDSDLEFYHRAYNEKALTFICPPGFPEKVGPLLQALHLSNCVVLYVDKIDAVLGEVILAIDASEIKQGFVAFDPLVDEELFRKISENTCVKGFERIEKDEILEKVSSIKPVKVGGDTIIDLDAMFDVKSVGTVALGFVAQGLVEQFQKIKAFPKNAEVLVKSIQKQDKVFKQAEFNERVGLALKGIDAEGFSRGMVLTSDGSFTGLTEFEIIFEKNSYCKKELKVGLSLHIQCRLQTVGCKIESLEPLKIVTGKSIAARPDEKIILIDINANPRIIGRGKIIK